MNPYGDCRDCTEKDREIAALERVAEERRNRAKDAEAEAARLRAEVDQLRRERDEARKKSEIDMAQCDEMTAEAGRLAVALSQAERERDEARAEAEIVRRAERARCAEALRREMRLHYHDSYTVGVLKRLVSEIDSGLGFLHFLDLERMKADREGGVPKSDTGVAPAPSSPAAGTSVHERRAATPDGSEVRTPAAAVAAGADREDTRARAGGDGPGREDGAAETRRLLVEAHKALRSYRSPLELMDEIRRHIEGAA